MGERLKPYWRDEKHGLVPPEADRYFLSYGGGVNSTALLALLHESGLWDEHWEAVFCDTGAEYPQVLAYVEAIRERYPVTIIKADIEGKGGLYEYCLHYRILPSRWQRWCTSKAKVTPLRAHVNAHSEGDAIEVIGYDAGEARRADRWQTQRPAWFPLIEADINREACKEIITSAGLPMPNKSGCFICPFARPEEYRRMSQEQPELFAKAVALEEACMQRCRENGRPVYTLLDCGPLTSIAAQGRLWEPADLAPPKQEAMALD